MFPIRQIAAIAILMTVGSAAAQQLTENDAVSRALSREALLQSQTGVRDAARADVARQSIWSNPSLSYLQEPGDGDDETTLALSQTFELGGRGLRVSAARTRGEAAEHEIAQLRFDVARDARLAFYELLAAQRSVELLARWGERVRQGSATIEVLQRGGEVSGYDRRRAERERLTVDARLRTERAR
ncbi:MAG: TolC family protein, partial [Thermoanaerobaculia bacterium]|nr:TolC family protein [Thermoanaerobaculia bacterium]